MTKTGVNPDKRALKLDPWAAPMTPLLASSSPFSRSGRLATGGAEAGIPSRRRLIPEQARGQE